MRVQILYLLIIFSFSNCAIALSGLQNGACTESTYTFEIKAKDTEAPVSKDVAITLTFSSPSASTQATCKNNATEANTDFVFTCTIDPASIDNKAVTIESVKLGEATLEKTGTFTIADVTCPAKKPQDQEEDPNAGGGAQSEEKNTLTITGKTEGSCTDKVYTFTVTGTVAKKTTAVTTWTPTFSAPTNPTATCSMPVVSSDEGTGTITCKITSALTNSAITLTKLVATGFNTVNLSGSDGNIATGKTCEGTPTTEDTPTSGTKFITSNTILFCILFFVF
jgi:hypothetical protein